MIISLSLQDVTFLLRNKNVTSTPHMNRTNFIPSPLPFVENKIYNSLLEYSFMPRRRLWYSTRKLKREFAYQTFIETIAGNHIECELKAVMDFIHYGLFEASKEKDFKAFSGIPLFCFNKQWLIIRILCPHETHTLHAYSLAPSRK